MSDEPVPAMLGHAGLVGRQQIARPLEGEFTEEGLIKVGVGAMPGNCRRMRGRLPIDQDPGCADGCEGRQRDGGCLLAVVRAAVAAGIADWEFLVDPVDGFWDYYGPPIPGREP